jgi:chemotaxis protein methyltransferase CheR
MSISAEDLARAEALVASRLGLEFQEARRADLERGLLRASRAASMPALAQFLAWLEGLPRESPEWQRLAAYLTIGETYFFRDPAFFDALEREVLPALIAQRRAEGALRLRFWSAGCATGEEPYSLAVLLDRSLPDLSKWAVTILATDINGAALESARRGQYREWSFRATPQWIRDRYFRRRRRNELEIDPRIRSMVTFAPLNLAQDVYPATVTNTSALDVILCRNALMYFTDDARRAAAARLRRALVIGGYLAVSAAEASADLFGSMRHLNLSGAIFYRKEPAVVHPTPRRVPSGGELAPIAAAGIVDEKFTVQCAPPSLAQASPSPAQASPSKGGGGSATFTQRARALADQGDLEGSLQLCEAALLRDRLDTEAHLLLAAIRQESGEIPAALQAVRRALYLDPDSAVAHFLEGNLLLRRGERARGRRAMETVVTLLAAAPRDDLVPASGGLTAGRLCEMAQAYLDT